MRPEAAAGARDARGRVCHCPADGSRRPPPPRGPERQQRMLGFTPGPCRSSLTPWRPWVLTPRDAEQTGTGNPLQPGGDQRSSGSKGAFGFQHPVRLYLPISKRQEYLQSSGEKVLASFPVQATIHFYNDESDTEDGELEEEALPCDLQGQEAGDPEENGPAGMSRDRLTHPGLRSGARSGPGHKHLLPNGDSPGGAQCASAK